MGMWVFSSLMTGSGGACLFEKCACEHAHTNTFSFTARRERERGGGGGRRDPLIERSVFVFG